MYKILVVDDEAKITELLKIYLEMQGMEVRVAQNGKEALEEFSAHPVDMVLTDIMMPVMDGYEFVEKLRRKSNVPVMFLTAKGDVPDRIRGLNAGLSCQAIRSHGGRGARVGHASTGTWI